MYILLARIYGCIVDDYIYYKKIVLLSANLKIDIFKASHDPTKRARLIQEK
jgi:hypothetical protein